MTLIPCSSLMNLEMASFFSSSVAYPTFAAYATDDEKKLAISEFIRDEHGIKVVDAVRELFKNQSIEAIDEDYILDLRMREFRRSEFPH